MILFVAHESKYTFHREAPHDLCVPIAVPHLTNIAANVDGLCSLDQQTRYALTETGVRFKRSVVFKPAVFWRRVSGGLARELHAVGCHDLTSLKPIEDGGRRVRWIFWQKNVSVSSARTICKKIWMCKT